MAAEKANVIDPSTLREKLRKAIEAQFLLLKNDNNGRLERAAEEIGAKRQQMQQYATGTTVPADVLLMAFLKWGVTIRIEEDHARQGEPSWWEFSMSGRDRGFQKPHPRPTQMSIFDALQDLEDNQLDVKILKKGQGRLELGVEIGFKKVKF